MITGHLQCLPSVSEMRRHRHYQLRILSERYCEIVPGGGGNDNWAPVSTKWVRNAETQTLSAPDSAREVSEIVPGAGGGGQGGQGDDNWAPVSAKWVSDAETQILSAQNSAS